MKRMNKARTEFFEILGYNTSEEVRSDEDFDVFEAKVAAGLSEETHTFIYVKTASTQEATKTLLESRSTSAFVLFPASLESRRKKLETEFGRRHQFFAQDDLLREKIARLLADYTASLLRKTPTIEHFVSPTAKGGSTGELTRTIQSWMESRGGPSEGGSQVRALLAPAGVGKTTLARHLARRLAERSKQTGKFPIYVEASHWAKMSVEGITDLWSMIRTSLQHFAPEIGLVRREQFDYLVRSGSIVFIFDGFDELCGHRLSPLNAGDVLRDLIACAGESEDARILITSRSVYWSSEVGDDESGIDVLRLLQFSKPQATKYFADRFRSDTAKRQRANELLSVIRRGNQPASPGGGTAQFTYHPFVVQLIGDAAEQDVPRGLSLGDPLTSTTEVLTMFCRRESVRQNLATEAHVQMESLEEIALDGYSSSGQLRPFPLEELLAAGFDDRDLSKLADHPLLIPTGEVGEIELRYPFLQEILVASRLKRAIDSLADGEELTRGILLIMNQLRSGKASVFDHLLNALDLGVEGLGKAFLNLPGKEKDAKSFMFHLVKLKAEAISSDRRDKTQQLLQAIGSTDDDGVQVVRNLKIVGNLDQLDLRSTCFRDSVFVDALFNDCFADETTQFFKCEFRGDFDIIGDPGAWARAEHVSSSYDTPAALRWLDIQDSFDGGDERIAQEALRLALAKFWRPGYLRRSIARADWNSGPLGRLQTAERIRRAMLKSGLLSEEEISGVSENGLVLNPDADEAVQQFMDNSRLTGRVFNAYEEIRKRI